ncbi:RT0821/Lpp0805 family surface protein [Roseibium sediminis]|uniref:RT0821/Lpp0805 family surface protein n=1 Tax=Roseibium sediminis TaxID=1775174 RepID=UPI001AD8C632|nr:RT0821/Lpp0805 family surface protein [Roseibium sediminis]
MGSNDVDTPTILTGSIPSNTDVAYADVDERDREILALTLDSASVDPADQIKPDQTLAWTNPESGNSGTISNVNLSALTDTGCLEFDTTANTIAGIKIYHGTACRDISQRMVITALAANNA